MSFTSLSSYYVQQQELLRQFASIAVEFVDMMSIFIPGILFYNYVSVIRALKFWLLYFVLIFVTLTMYRLILHLL